MKKRILAITLALIMCLTLIPATAFAAEATISLSKTSFLPGEDVKVSYSGVTQEMVDNNADVGIAKVGSYQGQRGGSYDYLSVGSGELNLFAPNEVGSYEVRLFKTGDAGETAIMIIPITVGVTQNSTISIDKSAYSANSPLSVSVRDVTAEMENASACVGIFKKDAAHNTGILLETIKAGDSTVGLTTPNMNGNFEVRLYGSGSLSADTLIVSVPFTVSGAMQASSWAQDELAEAEKLGLIPDVLDGADLTKPITRAEFAAVAVKVYENLADTSAIPVVNNPFADTKDLEVLKAYNVGITDGTSATTFAPNVILNREQTATMLTRVFKKVTLDGWTLKTDGEFTLPYTKPAPFADDAKISAYAKDSVYFMASNKIIDGVGNNMFAPKATTSAEKAANYASATREQALLIAVRMVKNLDK